VIGGGAWSHKSNGLEYADFMETGESFFSLNIHSAKFKVLLRALKKIFLFVA
jgi:hypothetical protein